MNLRKVLAGNGKKSIENLWDSTAAASDLGPIPRGVYEARLLKADVSESSTGKLRVVLKFQINNGEYVGRFVWMSLWLTPAGMPYTKRDLIKLSINNLDQLEQPLPKHHVCHIVVVLRKSDDGDEFNDVKSFDVIRFELEEDDPFAPQQQPVVPPSTPPLRGAPAPISPTTTPPLATPTLILPQKESSTSAAPIVEAPPVASRPNTIDASGRRPGTHWGGSNEN
jgi:hypothetical protein